MLFTITTDFFPIRFAPSEEYDLDERHTYVLPTLEEYLKEIFPTASYVKITESGTNNSYYATPKYINFLIEIDEGEIEDYCMRHKTVFDFATVAGKVYRTREEREYVDENEWESHNLNWLSVPTTKDDIVFNDVDSIGGIINYYMERRFEGVESWAELCNVHIS